MLCDILLLLILTIALIKVCPLLSDSDCFYLEPCLDAAMENSRDKSDLKPAERFSSESSSSLLSSDSQKFLSSQVSENKENMSDNKSVDSSSDSREASFHLRLDETQEEEEKSETKSKPDEGKWADKIKSLDKDKIKFQSSSSASPLASRTSLDESVIIEDSPVSRSISVIDISDSSFISPGDNFQLELEDTPKTSNGGDDPGSMTGPMSEILATNTLLYQDCINIDNVIDNDVDVQDMKASADTLLDFDHSKSVR